MKIIEYGIDINSDCHCDNCGWFVDNFGHHRARLVFRNINEEILPSWINEDARLDSLNFDSLISEFYENNPYSVYTNKTHKLWPLIYRYSLNDPEDPLSCKGLNDFLRFKFIKDNIDSTDLMVTARSMNLAISMFKLKKNLITYRGMSFNSKDDFVKMLDRAYTHLQKYKYFSFIDNGFVSTTLDINYAKSVMENSPKHIKVLCSYVSLIGSCCMPLSEEFRTTKNNFEKEVLFKCMQVYYICGIQKYTINDTQFYNCIIINSKEKFHD